MNQFTIQTEDVKYFYVFHGYVPGILKARVAYRLVDRHRPVPLRDRKVIKCPYCKEPLTDVDKETKVELYRYPARKHIRCQVYPVCQICKNEVGMILAS